MKTLTIPVGFRCYTSRWVRLNRSEGKSYPFHYGFFPVECIERFLLDDREIQLTQQNTTPVIKHGEMSHHIIFTKSTYNYINREVKKKYNNVLLDNSKGYYLLCLDWKCVFAHYIWHETSRFNYGRSIDQMLSDLSDTLTRRKCRLLEDISKADELELVYWEANGNHVGGKNLTDRMTIRDHTERGHKQIETFNLQYNYCEEKIKDIFSKYHNNIKMTKVSDIWV